MIHLVFSWSLECRTLYAQRHHEPRGIPFLWQSLSARESASYHKPRAYRESGARWEVLSTQRMLWEEVDMVVDNHQIADAEIWVHATRGIGKRTAFECPIHTSHVLGMSPLHIITLIKWKTAFHRQGCLCHPVFRISVSGMAFHRGYGEIRDVLIREFQCLSDFKLIVPDLSQNDGSLWTCCHPLF